MNESHELNPMTDCSEERLLSRLVEGAADADDWREWLQRTDRDESLWKELAALQFDHGQVQRVAERAARTADQVSLPMRRGYAPIIARIGAWSGWAVAAVIAVTAVSWQFANLRESAETGTTPEVRSISATDAFEDYLRLGRAEGLVIDELPTRILIDAREAPDGDGYDVLYLRQVLERVRVPDLFMIDDAAASGSTVTPASFNRDDGPL